jgi:superoxide dismutase, Fe-Mn family
MAHELPPLPYAKDALAPTISEETIEYHYGRHHQTYVNNLNGLVEGTPNADKSLEDLIKTAEGGLFNNAAQVWNHTFYWNCMSPNGGGQPSGDAAAAINSLGGYDEFVKTFSAAAAGQFGSGWAWITKDSGGNLAIETTANAGCPIRDGKTPILTLDVWEHAYYIDYRNARPSYIEAFWNVVNWDFVTQNLRA